jgi:hypothetical protein
MGGRRLLSPGSPYGQLQSLVNTVTYLRFPQKKMGIPYVAEQPVTSQKVLNDVSSERGAVY